MTDIRTNEFVHYETWASERVSGGYIQCTNACEAMKTAAGGGSIRLGFEGIYVQQWIRDFKTEQDVLKWFREQKARGRRVAVRGTGGRVAVVLAYGVGIFIGHFPYQPIEWTVSEWRKVNEIKKVASDKSLKDADIRRALYICSKMPQNSVCSRLSASIARGNDHLADAVCINYATTNRIRHGKNKGITIVKGGKLF